MRHCALSPVIMAAGGVPGEMPLSAWCELGEAGRGGDGQGRRVQPRAPGVVGELKAVWRAC